MEAVNRHHWRTDHADGDFQLSSDNDYFEAFASDKSTGLELANEWSDVRINGRSQRGSLAEPPEAEDDELLSRIRNVKANSPKEKAQSIKSRRIQDRISEHERWLRGHGEPELEIPEEQLRDRDVGVDSTYEEYDPTAHVEASNSEQLYDFSQPRRDSYGSVLTEEVFDFRSDQRDKKAATTELHPLQPHQPPRHPRLSAATGILASHRIAGKVASVKDGRFWMPSKGAVNDAPEEVGSQSYPRRVNLPEDEQSTEVEEDAQFNDVSSEAKPEQDKKFDKWTSSRTRYNETETAEEKRSMINGNLSGDPKGDASSLLSSPEGVQTHEQSQPISPGDYFRSRTVRFPVVDVTNSGGIHLRCEIGNSASRLIRVKNSSHSVALLSLSIQNLQHQDIPTISVFPSVLESSPREVSLIEIVYVPIGMDQRVTEHMLTIKDQSSGQVRQFRVTAESIEPQAPRRSPVRSSMTPLIMSSHRQLDFGDQVDVVSGSSFHFRLKNVHFSGQVSFFLGLRRRNRKGCFDIRRKRGNPDVLDPGQETSAVLTLLPDPSDPTPCTYSCLVTVTVSVLDGTGLRQVYSLPARGSTPKNDHAPVGEWL